MKKDLMSKPPTSLELLQRLFDHGERGSQRMKEDLNFDVDEVCFRLFFTCELTYAVSFINADHDFLMLNKEDRDYYLLTLIAYLYNGIPKGTIYKEWGMECIIDFASKMGLSLERLAELTGKLI